MSRPSCTQKRVCVGGGRGHSPLDRYAYIPPAVFPLQQKFMLHPAAIRCMMVARRSGAVDHALASENAGDENERYDAAQNSFEHFLRRHTPPSLSGPWRDPGGGVHRASSRDDREDAVANTRKRGRRSCASPEEDEGGDAGGGRDAVQMTHLLGVGGEPSFELEGADRRDVLERSSCASTGGASSSAGGGGDSMMEQQQQQPREQRRALAMNELEASMPALPPFGGYRPSSLSSSRSAGRMPNNPPRHAAAALGDGLAGDASTMWRTGDSTSFSRLLLRDGSCSVGEREGAGGIPRPPFSGGGGGSSVLINRGGGGGSCWAPHLGPVESGKTFAELGDIRIGKHGNNINHGNGEAETFHPCRQQSFDPDRAFGNLAQVDRTLADSKSQPAQASAAAAAAVDFIRTATPEKGADPGSRGGAEGNLSARMTDDAGAAWARAAAAVGRKPSEENGGAYGGGYGVGNDNGRGTPSSPFDFNNNNNSNLNAPVPPPPPTPRERLPRIPPPPAPIAAHRQGKRRFGLLAMMIPVPDISKFGGPPSSRSPHAAGEPAPAGLLPAREAAAAEIPAEGGGGAVWTRQVRPLVLFLLCGACGTWKRRRPNSSRQIARRKKPPKCSVVCALRHSTRTVHSRFDAP